MRVEGVPREVVATREELFRGYLDRLKDDDTEFLLRGIYAREFQCWAVGDDQIRAVVLTQLKEGPKGKTLEITHCTGDRLNLWRDAVDTFEQLARDAGCTAIEATGRPGWARLGRAHGFETHTVTVRKVI